MCFGAWKPFLQDPCETGLKGLNLRAVVGRLLQSVGNKSETLSFMLSGWRCLVSLPQCLLTV